MQARHVAGNGGPLRWYGARPRLYGGRRRLYGGRKRLFGARFRGYCYGMGPVWLLLFGWYSAQADWLREARERGAALETAQQWEQAAVVYQTALARLDSSGLRQDQFRLLTSLAEVSFERQEYRLARGWLRKAEEAINGLGEGAPERVRLLNAWGTLDLVEGNLTAAERELSRAVAISRRGGSPVDLAAALHNLAAVEMHTRHLAEATVHERQALAILRQELGDRHQSVMKAWISLSSLQGLCGNWRAAEASLQKALGIARTPEALANYAFVLEKLKRHREAREIRRGLQLPAPSLSPLADVKELPYQAERSNVQTR